MTLPFHKLMEDEGKIRIEFADSLPSLVRQGLAARRDITDCGWDWKGIAWAPSGFR